MKSFVSKRTDGLVLQSLADFRQVGRWFFGCSALLALALIPVVASSDSKGIEALFLLPGIPGGVGALFAVVGRKTWVDTAKREIRHAGQAWPFERIAAVHIWVTVREVEVEGGSAPMVRFCLGLLPREAVPAFVELLELYGDAIEAVAQGRDKELPEAARKDLDGSLARLAENVLTGTTPLVTAGDELAMWNAAEQVAKALGVPLLDSTGERPRLRTLSELDLPLAVRLRRRLERPGELGPTPPKVEEEVRGGRLTIRYRHSRMGRIAGVAVGAFLFVGFGVFSVAVGVWWLLLFFAVPAGALFAVLPKVGHGHGDNTIEVTTTEIRHHNKAFGDRTETMSLDELELMRVWAREQLPDSSLNLLGDERVVKLPMAGEHAAWIRDRIEVHLAGG